MIRNTPCLLFLLSSLAMLPACAGPVTYSAEPTEATIIDAETKQPLEGVIVVAHWVLEGGVHVSRVGELKILETTTDPNGRFVFPAWGPIQHWGRSRLTYMDPELLIFKSGYAYERLSNSLTPEAIKGKPIPVRRSEWSGKRIELKPFKGTGEEYAKKIYWLSNEMDSLLGFARSNKNCDWKKTPRILAALHKISLDLERQNLRPYGGRIHRIEDIPIEADCGSPKEFFKDYLP